jgi:hypothetical protein
MDNKQTPTYIKTLLMPSPVKAPQGRRVWSIDLETVWLPLFLATNTNGDSAIPHDALGAPIRLGYAKDGSVKFRANGRPATVVAKEVRTAVSLIRENFVATLKDYTHGVAEGLPDEYARQIQMCQDAGAPLVAHDKAQLEKAIQAQNEAQLAEAMATPTPEAEKEKVAA